MQSSYDPRKAQKKSLEQAKERPRGQQKKRGCVQKKAAINAEKNEKNAKKRQKHLPTPKKSFIRTLARSMKFACMRLGCEFLRDDIKA
jgi:hypothetical protein